MHYHRTTAINLVGCLQYGVWAQYNRRVPLPGQESLQTEAKTKEREAMARAAGMLGLLSLAPMVVFAASGASEVPLLGEEYLKDVGDYAKRIGDEAKELFKTPLEDWNFYGSYDHGLKVYWRPVKDNKVGFAISCCYVVHAFARRVYICLQQGSKLVFGSSVQRSSVLWLVLKAILAFKVHLTEDSLCSWSL